LGAAILLALWAVQGRDGGDKPRGRALSEG
jgi:hypothetical protein